MSDFQADVLRVFRVFGPCSNTHAARHLSMPPSKVYRIVYKLEQRGLLIHLNRARWDISKLGSDWFKRNGRKDIGLFCEGGTQ